MNISKKNT